MAGRHRQTRRARGRHRKPSRRGELVLPSLAAAAVLSLGGVGASAALGGGGSDVHGLGSPRPAPTVAFVPLPAPSAAAPAPTAIRAATAPRLDRLVVSTTGSVSWVQVVGPHHKTLYAGLLRHGRTLGFSQRPLGVTIGNAGAVRIVLRGHARRAGRPGAVVRFTVR